MAQKELEIETTGTVGIRNVTVTVDGKGKAYVDPETVEPDTLGDIYITLVSSDPLVKWVYFAKDPINIDHPKNFTHELDTDVSLHVTDSSEDKHEHPTHKYTLKVVKARDVNGPPLELIFVNSANERIDPIIKDH